MSTRRKFKIVVESTGAVYKPKHGEMLVMSSDGVFFLVSGLDDYYTSLRRLSDVVGNYDVTWVGEAQ